MLIFGSHVYDPNNHMMAYGGDPMIIYFDMTQYICYGEGVMLDMVNYPYGESIFMTDMQASISIVLRLINKVIPICGYIPGIVHGIIFGLLPLCPYFLYKIMRQFEIGLVTSIVGGLAITFLSPQILRITVHFGLAYPFLIPLSIYWTLQLYKSQGKIWHHLLYGFTILFFLLNNPYLGCIAAAIPLVAGLVMVISRKKEGLKMISAGLIPVVIGYLIITLTDPFQDRIQLQWGFFHYFASIHGLLIPEGSFLHSILSTVVNLPEARFEGKINLGVISTLLLVFYLGKCLIKRKSSINGQLPQGMSILMWAAFILFLYAANYSLYGSFKPFLEKHLGSLLMFKASGRVAWTAYYIISLFSMWLLYQSYTWINKKGNHNLATIFITICLSIWIAEGILHSHNRIKGINYENHFLNPDITKELSQLSLSDYQAIYTLPPSQAWNDKLTIPSDFQSEYTALILSTKTGIPLINSLISRAPLSTMLSSLQFTSNPVIDRSRRKDMENRPILVVKGKNYKPKNAGEKFMLDNSKPVGGFLKGDLYAFDMNKWDEKIRQDSIVTEPPHVYHSWERSNHKMALEGKRSLHLPEGEHPLYSYQDTIFKNGEMVQLSLWHYMDSSSYHIPQVILETNKLNTDIYNRGAFDYVGKWVRIQKTFLWDGKLEISSASTVQTTYDALEIRSFETPVYVKRNDRWYYNNYPVSESIQPPHQQ